LSFLVLLHLIHPELLSPHFVLNNEARLLQVSPSHITFAIRKT
jgi:hypothetical protein